ncbi:DUF3330 domain-containing protein, partial [Pseudomonas aeruginosa]
CYQRFQARAKTGSETDADPNACDSSLLRQGVYPLSTHTTRNSDSLR